MTTVNKHIIRKQSVFILYVCIRYYGVNLLAKTDFFDFLCKGIQTYLNSENLMLVHDIISFLFERECVAAGCLVHL